MDLFYDRMITIGGEVEWYWIFAIVMGGVALIFGLIACICTGWHFGKDRKKDAEEAGHIAEERSRKLVLSRRKSLVPKESKGEKHIAKKKKKKNKKKRKRTTSTSSCVVLPPLGPVEEEITMTSIGRQERVRVDFMDEVKSPKHWAGGDQRHSIGYEENQTRVTSGDSAAHTSSINRIDTADLKTIEGVYANTDSPQFQMIPVASSNGKILRGKHRHPLTPSGQSSKHGVQVHSVPFDFEPQRSITPTDGSTFRIESEMESDYSSQIELRPMTSTIGPSYAPKNRMYDHPSETSSGIGSSVMTIDTQTNFVPPREGAVIEESDSDALTRKLMEQALLEKGYDNEGFDVKL